MSNGEQPERMHHFGKSHKAGAVQDGVSVLSGNLEQRAAKE